MRKLSRRGFIGGVAALGTATASPSLVLAQAPAGPAAPSQGLPARGEFVIRNGFVMTMDAAVGDIAGGSVHVRNGETSFNQDLTVGRELLPCAAPGGLLFVRIHFETLCLAVSAVRHFFSRWSLSPNPNGIPPQSPGLRGTSYPGK